MTNNTAENTAQARDPQGSLKERIRQDLTTAMKAKDKPTTSALRMLLAAIQAEETSTGTRTELTDDDVLKVIAREIKKRRESAGIYRDNGRDELAEAEEAEVAVFENYQPRQLSDDELGELAADAGEELSMKHMGQVMKAANAKASGRADGKRISEAVKARLQG
ncbi:GatB/YqeY domain-containing protein [Corynebacterium propinquum]